jgi:hypothetical protein
VVVGKQGASERFLPKEAPRPPPPPPRSMRRTSLATPRIARECARLEKTSIVQTFHCPARSSAEVGIAMRCVSLARSQPARPQACEMTQLLGEEKRDTITSQRGEGVER